MTQLNYFDVSHVHRKGIPLFRAAASRYAISTLAMVMWTSTAEVGLAQTPSFYSYVDVAATHGRDGNSCDTSQTSANTATVSHTCVSGEGVAAKGSAYGSLQSGLLSTAFTGRYIQPTYGQYYNDASAQATLVDDLTIVGPLPHPETVTFHLSIQGKVSGAPDASEYYADNLALQGKLTQVYFYDYDGVDTDPVAYQASSQTNYALRVRSLVARKVNVELTSTVSVSDANRDISLRVDASGEAEPCYPPPQSGQLCTGTGFMQISFPTVQLSIDLPPGLSFISASGVLLTQ